AEARLQEAGFLSALDAHAHDPLLARQAADPRSHSRRREDAADQPWEPIQDKRLKYEMTIVVPMTLDGAYETEGGRLKAPGDLAHLFKGELLDEKTGMAIAEWVNGGRPVDHALELLRRAGFGAASGGPTSLSKWWNSAPVRGRRKA